MVQFKKKCWGEEVSLRDKAEKKKPDKGDKEEAAKSRRMEPDIEQVSGE